MWTTSTRPVLDKSTVAIGFYVPAETMFQAEFPRELFDRHLKAGGRAAVLSLSRSFGSFRQAAKDSVPFMRQLWDERELKARKTVDAAGTQVIMLSDKAAFMDAMKPVYARFADSPKLKDLVFGRVIARPSRQLPSAPTAGSSFPPRLTRRCGSSILRMRARCGLSIWAALPPR